MSRSLFVFAAVLCALFLPAAARAAVITVHVFSFDYSTNPPGQPIVDPTINVGDTIRWQFDESGHTTTSVDGIPEKWDSNFVASGSSYTHTFTHVGSFEYYCQPHGFDFGNGHAGGMAGVINVRAVPEPSSAASVAAALAGLALRRRRR